MSQDEPPAFAIDIGALRSRSKDSTRAIIEKVDQVGEQHGFIPREPSSKRGRKPSPRTGQVHAKVMPHVAEEIGEEARRRGVQQGVVVEEAWALYCQQHKE